MQKYWPYFVVPFFVIGLSVYSYQWGSYRAEKVNNVQRAVASDLEGIVRTIDTDFKVACYRLSDSISCVKL